MNGKIIGGLIVTGIGIIMVLQKMNIIVGDFWDYFWPGVLILIGLSMLFNRKK